MNINLSIVWDKMEWGEYTPIIERGIAQINESKTKTVSPEVLHKGACIALPVVITSGHDVFSFDVIGEVTEVLIVDTVSVPYDIRVSINILSPLELT